MPRRTITLPMLEEMPIELLRPAALPSPAIPPTALAMGTLGKAAKVLKLDGDTLSDLAGGLGEAVSFGAALIGVGGTVLAAIETYKKLTGDDKTAKILEGLARVEAKADAILDYLDVQDRDERRRLRGDWREAVRRVESKLATLGNSRSEKDLDELSGHLSALSGAMQQMLAAGSRPYLRPPFPPPHDLWWKGAVRSPWMRRQDGGAIDVAASPVAGLWDGGWFLPVLVRALIVVPAAMRMLEAGARSTGWERLRMRDLAGSLDAFARAWRDSIVVTDAAAWIGLDGRLSQPSGMPLPGILVGAADPSTGVAVSDPSWTANGRMQLEAVTEGSLLAKGAPDYYRCLNPDDVLQPALVEREAMRRAVEAQCGLPEMRELARLYQAWAAPFEGSEFVDLAPATFLRLLPPEAGEDGVRPVVTGLDGFWSPRKDYQGPRIHQGGVKRFGFDAARRADRSGIQLGYRLRLGDRVLDLVPFSTAGAPGGAFPTETLRVEIRGEMVVHDCAQAAILSTAQEDAFERDGQVPGVPRAFLNPRLAPVALDVEIGFAFDPAAPGPNPAGRISVAIRNPAPREFPHAILLRVEVLETRILHDDPTDPMIARRAEVVADAMTVHLVPSFILLEAAFFEDLQAARQARLRHIPGLLDGFSLEEMMAGGIRREPIPGPDPRWGALDLERRLDWATEQFDAARRAFPERVAVALEALRVPRLR
jgi:hypothetical protein